jgi:hypothetical protein
VLNRHNEVAVCRKHPGFNVDLQVRADAMALHRVWMGRLDFVEALARRQVVVEGPPELARAFPEWPALSTFAYIAPASESTHMAEAGVRRDAYRRHAAGAVKTA